MNPEGMNVQRCKQLRLTGTGLLLLMLLSSCGGGGQGNGASAAASGSSPQGNASEQSTPGLAGGNPSLAVTVVGNRLVDAAGSTLQLRGVNVSGLESVAIQGWDPANPWGGQTGTATPDWSTIKTWQANTVRLPLNEASWLGVTCIDAGGVRGTVGAQVSADPGANYKATVAQSVAGATSAGLYVILDLHWTAPGNNCPFGQNPMADAQHSLSFWKQVAGRFKTYPNVIFELFNEPYLYWIAPAESAWSVLMNGGTETEFVTGGNPYAVALNWQTAGMQQMLTTIRATGAKNVVLASGASWAQDLSGWLSNRPSDPLQQLGAVWHAYPTFGAAFGSAAYAQPNDSPQIWSEVQGILAAGFPVVITEYGDQDSAGTTSAPFASNLLPWADQNGVSYLGWAWDVWQDANNVLITDAAGDPTPGFGVYVKQHYLCRAAGTANCP
jgi:aryl-phospho-beta-D-glucosidase BglC (GH1 family)